MKRITILSAVLAVFAPGASIADPGGNEWSRQGGGFAPSRVNSGTTVEADIVVGSTNTVAITLNAQIGDICFDPDTQGSSGTARISGYRAISDESIGDSAIALPAIPFDDSDCVQIVRGTYWVEIDVPATGAEAGLVTITGR